MFLFFSHLINNFEIVDALSLFFRRLVYTSRPACRLRRLPYKCLKAPYDKL